MCISIFISTTFINAKKRKQFKCLSADQWRNQLSNIHTTKHGVCACVRSFSWIQLFETPWTAAHQAPLSMKCFQARNTGVGCHFLLQGSSRPRDWNPVSYVSCFGRHVRYHCTTWEALNTIWLYLIDIVRSKTLVTESIVHMNACGNSFEWMNESANQSPPLPLPQLSLTNTSLPFSI